MMHPLRAARPVVVIAFVAVVGAVVLVSNRLVREKFKRPIKERMKNEATPSPTLSPTSRSNSSLWSLVGCQSEHAILLCAENARNDIERVLPQYRFASIVDFGREEFLRHAHLTCAIVGSSGNLLKYEFGPEIDGRDVIMRINDAPIAGYEKHVGKRLADVIVLNRGVKQCPRTQSRNQPTFLVHNYPNVKWNTKQVLACWNEHARKIYAYSPRVLDLTIKLVRMYKGVYNTRNGYRYPTAGMYSVVWALHMCREVHIYGFGMVEADKFEYYRDMDTVGVVGRDAKKKPPHDFLAEQHFMTDYALGKHDNTKVNLTWSGYGKIVLHGPPLLAT